MINRSFFHIDKLLENQNIIFGEINLIQIGDLHCNSLFEVTPHHQMCYEVTLAVSGKGTCVINDSSFTLTKGSVHFCNKNSFHKINSDGTNPLRYFYIGFNLTEKGEKLYKPIMDKLISNEQSIVQDNFYIEQNFLNIFTEINNAYEYTEKIIGNEIENILYKMYRNYSHLKNNQYIKPKKKSNLLYDIIFYIDENFKEINNIKEISDSLGYNYQYISTFFSNSTGKTLKEYIIQKKLDYSKSILETTDLSITQISELLNYNSIYSYTRAFKKHFKMSPTNYRKCALNNASKIN